MNQHLQIIDAPRKIDLDDIDPADTRKITKEEATAETPRLVQRLAALQELLYAASRHSVLIVLQGMDTSGKDGTVKHVMAHINPTGCQVWNFKVPTAEELAHDFLWRIHHRAPGRGTIAIFNRSHYEDVLVARVHELVPKEVWKARYDQINQFEQLLAANQTIIFKFFLHITKDEQRHRLLAREEDPDKSWKLSVGDWQERAYWRDYQKAYAQAIGKCATPEAPWNIVPANQKWYRDYVIASALVDRLGAYEAEWKRSLETRGKTELAALQQFRAEHGENAERPNPDDGEKTKAHDRDKAK